MAGGSQNSTSEQKRENRSGSRLQQFVYTGEIWKYCRYQEQLRSRLRKLQFDCVLQRGKVPDRAGISELSPEHRNRSVNCVVIKRGDIFYADLRPVVGSEQGGIRPVLIIQNDVGNKHSPTVICAAITSKMNKAKLPTHIEIDASSYDLVRDSVILLEQLRTIDKRRLKDKVCHLDQELLDQVNQALKISLELPT